MDFPIKGVDKMRLERVDAERLEWVVVAAKLGRSRPLSSALHRGQPSRSKGSGKQLVVAHLSRTIVTDMQKRYYSLRLSETSLSEMHRKIGAGVKWIH